jgi:cbb3-type cytochrome oxidase subunit 3
MRNGILFLFLFFLAAIILLYRVPNGNTASKH